MHTLSVEAWTRWPVILSLCIWSQAPAWAAGQIPEQPWKIDQFLADPGLDLLAGKTLESKPEKRSDNEWLTTRAWQALKENRFRDASQVAAAAVKRFGPAADKIQQSLNQSNVPVPVPAQIDTDEERKEAFARGPLNDVAACYFILGKALSARSRSVEETPQMRLQCNQLAKEACRKAAQYPHALVWDPAFRGFWRPAREAPAVWRKASATPRVAKIAP